MAEVLLRRSLPGGDDVRVDFGFLVDDVTGQINEFGARNDGPDTFNFTLDYGVRHVQFSLAPGQQFRRNVPDGIVAVQRPTGRWYIPFTRLAVERRFAVPITGSPTILGVTTNTFNTDATAHLHVMPSCDVGDLLLIVFGGNTPNAHTAVTTTQPAEFTEILDNGNAQFNDAGDLRVSIGVFAKNAEGDEDGGNADVVTNQAIAGSGHIYHIDAGTWSGDVTDIETADNMVIDGTANSPNLAPTHGSQDYMWLAAAIADNDGPIITGAPTSYTNFTSTEANSTEDSTFTTARRALTASSEDPAAWTQGGGIENCVAVTIAIPPTLVTEEGTVGQEGYRFRNDDGDEDAATWMAAQDVPMLWGLRNTTGTPGGTITSSPRRAGINVTTGNMYIVAHIRPDDATHTASILSRFEGAGQYSFYFMLRSDAAVLFGYSADGTAVVDLESTVAWTHSGHTQPIAVGQSFWIAVSHEPGAGTRVTKFYLAPARELLAANQLGATVTFGTTGVIHDATTAPYKINARADGGFHMEGDIYGVWAYAGLDETGTLLLNPDFSDRNQGWEVGDASANLGVDSVGNIWTIDDDHEIMGGVDTTEAFRLRILSNAETNDPPTQTMTLMYKRVDEPDSEWRIV